MSKDLESTIMHYIVTNHLSKTDALTDLTAAFYQIILASAMGMKVEPSEAMAQFIAALEEGWGLFLKENAEAIALMRILSK